jgi:hypothetical protein
MPERCPFLLYLRSRLNFWVAGTAAAFLILSGVFLGRWFALAAPLIVVLYAASTFVFFYSKRGARQIVEEGERDRLAMVRRKIDGTASLRERLSVLRVADPVMTKTLEYFLLASGTYIEKCRETDLYSPRANAKIEDVQGILQAFLGEMDESSTEKRYGARDGESFEEFSARCVEAVREAASDLTKWTTEDLVGLSARDSLEIMKELEGGK